MNNKTRKLKPGLEPQAHVRVFMYGYSEATRGNHSAGSQVMNQAYDYAVGLGPLASNSLPGARRLGLRDVKLLIPASRSSL
jgi:hypothetical protein